jgi:hypothetical protein
MRTIFLVGLVIIQFSGWMQAQERSLTTDKALKLVREEKIYVSRMLKDIVLIASNYLHKQRAIHELEVTKKMYADGLKQLRTYESVPAWREMIAAVEKQWTVVLKLTTEVPNKKYAGTYIHAFGKLKFLWAKPIGYLMKKVSEKKDDPVTVLSNFKIFSEQMTTMYLLRSWQLKDPTRVDKASHAIGKKVYQGFQILLASPKTTSQMKEVIQEMRKLSLYFRVMWDSEVRTPTVVVKKAKDAYNLAAKLLEMYQAKD